MRKLLSQAFKRAAERLYCDLCYNQRIVPRGSTGTTSPCPRCRPAEYGNWIDNSPEHQAVTAHIDGSACG